MRIPEFLKENGSIGFVAPSFGCNIEPYKSAFDNAQKKFTQMGYKMVVGPNCYEGSGIGISNTPEKCGDELNDFIINSKADVIISCGGGELMCETLDFVDFDSINKAKPIWYMGFSDNTNMTFLLPVLCDTAAIYAPCAPAFGMREWHQSVEDAFKILIGKKSTVNGYDKWEKESLKTEENPLEPYNLTEPRILKSFNCGDEVSMEGRLIGGCLDCLSNLVGTRYDKVREFNNKYKEDGIIWFFEACDLNVMGIRRALWQLKSAGWFENLKGFMVGRPLCFGENF
ncbi:MAG: LD-carboxypeptidase, partial [Lachnospiraceae bacterium]|nr:LD-carboxypeptidase [Lachnospiraceae bacterium]